MDTVRPKVKPSLLLTAGFVLLGLCVVSAVWVSLLQRDAANQVQHTLEVQNRLSGMRTMIRRAESQQRGYLLTSKERYLGDYRQIAAALPREIDELQRETQDNPAQQTRIAALREAAGAKLAELDETLRLYGAGRKAEALAVISSDRGLAAMNRITEIAAAMQKEENRLLAQRRYMADRRVDLAVTVLAISAVLVLGLGFFARALSRRYILALEDRNRELHREITARAQAQSQVRQLQKMEAVGQLTGGIAHDFNNMLAIIQGSLDLARLRLKREDLPAVQRSLDHAQEGTQRAALLTSQLLAFARSQPLEPRVVEPNRFVGNMSELLRRTLGERIEIETVLAGGLWRIHTDPAQIESALVNLAVNARDAMPEGGKLTIETANSELDDRYARMHDEVLPGQYVMISVTDTGSGMPQDVIDRAFEPFFTTKGVGRGTGLGLSQVFGFVKQSNGHIKIYSELGKGTTIRIYLPRYFGEATPIAPHATTHEIIVPARAGEIILVAEDDMQVRPMTVSMLTELGYQVLEAGNGAEAMTVLEARDDVTLLFTDIVMPGMTGRELADRAVALRPALKILFTTGYTRNAIVHNGMVDQGVAFIQKPFLLDALARKIRETIDAG